MKKKLLAWKFQEGFLCLFVLVWGFFLFLSKVSVNLSELGH